MELAVLLGKTVSELDSLLSPEEINMWFIYLAREPRGWSRLEYQFANVVYSLVGCWAKHPPKFEDAFVKFKIPLDLRTEFDGKDLDAKLLELAAYAAQHNANLRKK